MLDRSSVLVLGCVLIALGVLGGLLVAKGRYGAAEWLAAPTTTPLPSVFLLGVSFLGISVVGLVPVVVVWAVL